MQKDMTSGNPLSIILSFALPMLLGSVFQQLYSIVDMLVVGNIIGSRALAAIGATGAANFFAMALIIGMTTGFTAVMSRYFGAKNETMFKKAYIATLLISVVISFILILFGIFGTEPLLRLLNTPEDIISDAVMYLKICLIGSVGMVFYNSAAAILRAVGDSRTPLLFLIISSVLSMVLDLWFIIGLGMGVEGAAIATVVAQILSAAACLVYMVKRFEIFRLRFNSKDWLPENKARNAPLFTKICEIRFEETNRKVGSTFLAHKKVIISILKIGLPVCFQSMLLSIGDMTITAVVNQFGPDVVAAYATASRIMFTAMMFAMNLAMAYAVFAGQNLGADNVKRIKIGFKHTMMLVVALSVGMTGAVFIFGDSWVRFFIADTDAHIETVLVIARGAMRIPAMFYIFLGAIWLYNYTLRGMGDVVVPFISGMLELAAKVGLSIVFGYWFGYVGVWFAMPVGWVVGIIPSVIRFHLGGWEKKDML